MDDVETRLLRSIHNMLSDFRGDGLGVHMYAHTRMGLGVIVDGVVHLVASGDIHKSFVLRTACQLRVCLRRQDWHGPEWSDGELTDRQHGCVHCLVDGDE